MSCHPSISLLGRQWWLVAVAGEVPGRMQDGRTPTPLILGADPTQDFTKPPRVLAGWSQVKTAEASILESKLGFHAGLVIPCCVTLHESLSFSEPTQCYRRESTNCFYRENARIGHRLCQVGKLQPIANCCLFGFFNKVLSYPYDSLLSMAAFVLQQQN